MRTKKRYSTFAGMRGRLHRREARVRDRRRRQPRPVARVVRVVALELGDAQRLRPGHVEPVPDRRVDPERHPGLEPVVDHRRDQRPLVGRDRLLLDHRGDDQDVVGRQVLRLREAQVDLRPVGVEELELVGDELLRGRLRRELVRRREEEALDSSRVLAERGRHLRRLGRFRVRVAGELRRHLALRLRDLAHLGDALHHLLPVEALREDDAQDRRRRRRRHHRFGRRLLRATVAQPEDEVERDRKEEDQQTGCDRAPAPDLAGRRPSRRPPRAGRHHRCYGFPLAHVR